MAAVTMHHFSGLAAPFVRSKGTVSGGVFILRPDTIQAVTSKLKMAYGEKFAPIILADSKRDVAELLGEETEVRSIHEDLQKKHEQEVECKKYPPRKKDRKR